MTNIESYPVGKIAKKQSEGVRFLLIRHVNFQKYNAFLLIQHSKYSAYCQNTLLETAFSAISVFWRFYPHTVQI